MNVGAHHDHLRRVPVLGHISDFVCYRSVKLDDNVWIGVLGGESGLGGLIGFHGSLKRVESKGAHVFEQSEAYVTIHIP